MKKGVYKIITALIYTQWNEYVPLKKSSNIDGFAVNMLDFIRAFLTDVSSHSRTLVIYSPVWTITRALIDSGADVNAIDQSERMILLLIVDICRAISDTTAVLLARLQCLMS